MFQELLPHVLNGIINAVLAYNHSLHVDQHIGENLGNLYIDGLDGLCVLSKQGHFFLVLNS